MRALALNERIPASVMASLALHAAGLGLWLKANRAGERAAARVIADVDLLIKVHRPTPLGPAAKPAPPPSMLAFLKMALPSAPRAAPRSLDVKLPEARKPLLPDVKRIEDRGRLDRKPKLEALDLGAKRLELAKLDAAPQARRVSAAALAELPKLEEVGARRVKNLPQALAIEERRQEALALQRIASAEPQAPSRRAAPAAVLREASPPEASRLGDKMASVLPAEERLDLRPQLAAPPPLIKKVAADAPAASRRRLEALGEKKKAVEIEGPLADRRVVSFEVPEFPAWLKSQGVLEAAVALRFTVAPDGAVLPGMRVERTSGYGRLDRLALDALAKWRFAPLPAAERQWGVITFRFVLE